MRLCIRGGQSQNFASHEFKLGNYQKFLSLLPDKRLSFLTHALVLIVFALRHFGGCTGNEAKMISPGSYHF